MLVRAQNLCKAVLFMTERNLVVNTTIRVSSPLFKRCLETCSLYDMQRNKRYRSIDDSFRLSCSCDMIGYTCVKALNLECARDV